VRRRGQARAEPCDHGKSPSRAISRTRSVSRLQNASRPESEPRRRAKKSRGAQPATFDAHETRLAIVQPLVRGRQRRSRAQCRRDCRASARCFGSHHPGRSPGGSRVVAPSANVIKNSEISPPQTANRASRDAFSERAVSQGAGRGHVLS
jgi:hypothetical protein